MPETRFCVNMRVNRNWIECTVYDATGAALRAGAGASVGDVAEMSFEQMMNELAQQAPLMEDTDGDE